MLTGDLSATAREDRRLRRFPAGEPRRPVHREKQTNDGIVATAASQTQWLLSQPMLDDLAKDGIDFARLKDQGRSPSM